MFYIHQISMIAPFTPEMLFGEQVPPILENKLQAIEPGYENIPRTALRRMAKAVRLAAGAAQQIRPSPQGLNGIVIGTANGGMEESVKFMNQIMEYEEGMLTPGNFVQSTPNGLAAQIAMFLRNQQYNSTHTHRGLSFENALTDVDMLLEDHPGHEYLVGSADEISSYNFNIDLLAGWYKNQKIQQGELYRTETPGSIAGEGAAMFLTSKTAKGSICSLNSVHTLHSEDHAEIAAWSNSLAASKAKEADVLMLGDSGDSRFRSFYDMYEKLAGPHCHILRFKHLSGEFSTASGIGLFLLCEIARKQKIPAILQKRTGHAGPYRKLLLYNNYHGYQHALMEIQVQP